MAKVKVYDIGSTYFSVKLTGLQAGVSQGVDYKRRCHWVAYNKTEGTSKACDEDQIIYPNSTEGGDFTFTGMSPGCKYEVYCDIYGDYDHDNIIDNFIKTLGCDGAFWTTTVSIKVDNITRNSFTVKLTGLQDVDYERKVYYTAYNITNGTDNKIPTFADEYVDISAHASEGGEYTFTNMEPNNKYYVYCNIYNKDTDDRLTYVVSEPFYTQKNNEVNLPTLEDYDCSGDMLWLWLKESPYNLVAKAVDEEGNKYTSWMVSNGFDGSWVIIKVPLKYGAKYKLYFGYDNGEGDSDYYVFYGYFYTAPPPVVIKNVAVNNWTITIDWEIDDANIADNIPTIQVEGRLSKKRSDNKTILINDANIDTSEMSGLHTYTDSYDGYEYKHYYWNFKVTMVVYEKDNITSTTYTYGEKFIVPQEVVTWTWSDTALNAFQNHGYTTALTVDEWNEFVEFVAIKTGYDLKGDLMTATDNIMTASRFNHIRNAIGSLNTFREGQNSIREYIETRNAIEGVDDWDMRKGEVVKGQYFIDLAEYANKIQ
jgi:hypothetical protein